MSDGKIKRYDGVATRSIRNDNRWGVGTFCVSDAVNPSEGIANVVDIGVIS